MTKETRELREHESLFTDERYAKKAWKQLIGKSLNSDAVKMADEYDAKGNVIPNNQIYNMAVDEVIKRLLAEGQTRKPTKAEVLIEANIIRAAYDNTTFSVILDRTAGKVKEELNIGIGQFEELSDEELELLVRHREKKQLAEGPKE